MLIRGTALAVAFLGTASSPVLGQPVRASAMTSAAAAPAPRQPVTTVSGVSGRAAEEEPTAQEVADAQAAADDAHAKADAEADTLGDARSVLAAAAAASGLALERYRGAVQRLQQAQLDQQREAELLDGTRRQVETRRNELGRWARQAYSAGSPVIDYPAVATLLAGGSTDDLGTTMVVLRRVGDSQERALNRLRAAEQAQTVAEARTRLAADTAADATVRAATLKQEAEATVTRQQATVDRLQASLAGARQAAEQADQQAARLAAARALADERARAWTRNPTGPVGSCSGSDLSGFANGTIPVSALCPLWGAPGHHLRADAAFAFGRLSQTYAADFGTPLCVTDSYRTYAAQVQVYAEKPGLAAVPGTSNHGWGTALDLCGGVESFGTPAHEWMLLHAPLFGWFHPAWAAPSGSMPEPWHWEYGG